MTVTGVNQQLLHQVSVVVPTRNCLHLVESGMEKMCDWSGLVREVIVVDSESTDGTMEFLKQSLTTPNVRFLSHPPGLYQSWNHGISQTSGEYVHISTSGDTITAEDLCHLVRVGNETGADVITAPPRFVFANDGAPAWPRWPIHDLLERSTDEVVVLEGLSLQVFAMEYCRLSVAVQSWLGSSASNVYRGASLRTRPFPVDCGHSGDVMFGLRYAKDLKAAFLRRTCGTFVFHPPTSEQPDVMERFGEVYAAEFARCHQSLLNALRGPVADSELRSVLNQPAEASFWKALAHTPQDMLHLAAKFRGPLEKEMKKKRRAMEKLAAMQTERDEWKERARSAEAALRRCRKLIPGILRRWLKVETRSESSRDG